MKIAQEVLWQKGNVNNFIESGALVIDALNRLNEVDLSYLIVKDGDEVLGVFSERDYARKVALQGRSSASTKVGEIMTVNLPRVQVSDSLEACMNLLADRGRRYVLVMSGTRFEGVITIHDLLREVLLHGERALDTHVTRILIDINEKPPKVY